MLTLFNSSKTFVRKLRDGWIVALYLYFSGCWGLDGVFVFDFVFFRELDDGRVVYQGNTDEDGCTEETHSYYAYMSM